jgi:hypothetical protein
MAYSFRQLAGIDPLFVADGEPVYLDTPRDPAPGPRRYGHPPTSRAELAALEAGIDRTIQRLDLEAGTFDPFTDAEAAGVNVWAAFDPDLPF